MYCVADSFITVLSCQVAVEHYGEVITNLEFARDLQKQFSSINTDVSSISHRLEQTSWIFA